jgi:hypothetical protein
MYGSIIIPVQVDLHKTVGMGWIKFSFSTRYYQHETRPSLLVSYDTVFSRQ